VCIDVLGTLGNTGYILNMRIMALCVALAVGAGTHANDAHQIPATLHREGDERPLWASATAAIAPDGSLNPELVGGSFAATFRDQLGRVRAAQTHSSAQSSGDDCLAYFGRIVENYVPDRPLTRFISDAKAIFSAHVVAIEEGFFAGQPGSLLALAVDETFRASPAIDTSREVYLFYPHARIATRDGLICARPVGTSLVPRLGDRVLLFPTSAAADRHRRIVRVDPRDIVLQRGDQNTLPKAFAGLTYAQVLTDLRALKDSRGGRER
jgi:hypothetical protein